MGGTDGKQRFATRCIHAGNTPDPATGAVSVPIYQTSTYAQSSPGVFKGEYDYSRSANPTRTALQTNLASLEGARHGLCFSSGVASIDATCRLLKPGEHILLCDDVYGGTFRIFKRVFEPTGIVITRVDMTDHDATRAAIRPNTRLVWLETPTNPTLKVIDIAAMAEMAHKAGALLAVDNTFATPVLQNPLALGADIVSHSVTKYLGGHADVVGGALLCNDDGVHERLKFTQNAVGAVPGPMDCYLILRSTKTLHLRVERHCRNAERVAAFMEAHPKIEKVVYPGLESHPQHAVARKQMCGGFGGMITAYLRGGLSESRRFLERVRLFTLAESLGGVESLIEHPGIMTHASVPADERAKLGISDSLVRFSVGIEDVEDIIGDIEQALAAI
ncbi:MAG: cystathionine gamma-synthase [Phycisphaerales bacterium]|nr:cystathionine gamma-synthase [Phycisphaerales bacterium]